MTLTNLLAIIAFICSIVLLQLRPRTYPIIALIASGLHLAMSFRLVRFAIPGVPFSLVLGIVLTAAGVLMFLKVGTKNLSATSAILALAGIIQLLIGLRIIRRL